MFSNEAEQEKKKAGHFSNIVSLGLYKYIVCMACGLNTAGINIIANY